MALQPVSAEEKAAHERWRTLAANMQELMGHFAWDAYREQLEQLEARVTERMVGGSREEFEYLKGRIEGLREAYSIPTKIMDKARSLQDG